MNPRIIILLSVLLLMLTIPAFAQTDTPDKLPNIDEAACPVLVEVALERTDESCDATNPNELCYGHSDLEADPQAGFDDLNLREPGDTAELTRVSALRLSPMDTDLDTWGVAIMQVRALLTGNAPLTQLEAADPANAPKDVTFLLFGNVALSNQVKFVEVEARREANIRSAPSTADDSKIIGSIYPVPATPTIIVADGRTTTGDWIRIRVPDREGVTGWVRADLLDTPSEIFALPIIAESDEQLLPLMGSMQAFYLESGQDDAPCSAAPDSGMMIQTEEGAAEVTLLMNEANIQLRATAYVQAQAGNEMRLFVLEGEATVESGGESRTLVPGTTLSVPLDENGRAAGVPSAPEPFDPEDLTGLPISLLNRPVEIPAPLAVQPGVPLGGDWNFLWNVTQADCGGQVVAYTNEFPGTSIVVEGEGESFTMLLTRFVRQSEGQYAATFPDNAGNQHKYSVTVSSFDKMAGQAEIFDPLQGCTMIVPFTLTLNSPISD